MWLARGNCAEIWQKVKVENRARKTHTRYRVLELSMLSTGSGGYPQLKGNAHAIKHLGFILRDLFHAMSDTTDAFHMAIPAALDSLCRLEEILNVTLNVRRPAKSFNACCWRTCATHKPRNSSQMSGGNSLLYSNKHHWLIHAGHRAMFQNPRMGWCFQGVDLMLKVRTMTHPCTFGTKWEAVHKNF